MAFYTAILSTGGRFSDDETAAPFLPFILEAAEIGYPGIVRGLGFTEIASVLEYAVTFEWPDPAFAPFVADMNDYTANALIATISLLDPSNFIVTDGALLFSAGVLYDFSSEDLPPGSDINDPSIQYVLNTTGLSVSGGTPTPSGDDLIIPIPTNVKGTAVIKVYDPFTPYGTAYLEYTF